MTAFEDLKSQWKDQSQPKTPNDGVETILNKIKFIGKQQRITNVVLGITSFILIGFFFYVSAYNYPTVTIGLLLMIGSLALRIGLEYFSMRALKTMNVSTNVETFRQRMIRYYKRRTKVHFIITPLLIALYCVGFIMLLPSFKESLSDGFYNYIIVSSIVVFLVLSLFIAREIKRELGNLKELQR